MGMVVLHLTWTLWFWEAEKVKKSPHHSHCSRKRFRSKTESSLYCLDKVHGNTLCYPMTRIDPSVQFTKLCLTFCDPMDCSTPGFSVHHQLPELVQTHVHPNISSSVILFSSCLQSFHHLSFPMSQFFTSGGQVIGVSASASVLPMNIQEWFPSGLTGLISLQSKWLSRTFYNTTVQKHQLIGSQLYLWSNSHIHTWLLEKP